uniref:Uncharacterized protein n=1 Tax=Timema genevievae TaxID=629358 RepID=A0A7R9K2V2_TIMGE|nr:unnamed protein product [Timema genevievae]
MMIFIHIGMLATVPRPIETKEFHKSTEDVAREKLFGGAMSGDLGGHKSLKTILSWKNAVNLYYAPIGGVESCTVMYEDFKVVLHRMDEWIVQRFRKLFSESNVTFLGTSPKRSISSLSKMALSGSASSDATV